MVQIFQNLERLGHDGVAFFALDVCHKTHATGVVLVRGVVQTVFLEMLQFGSRGRHGISFNSFFGRG